MYFLTANWIVGLTCAWVFFMMGRHDAAHANTRDYGMLWAALSVVTTAVVIRGLDGGIGHVIGAQLVLFVGIGVVRAVVGTR